MTNVESLSKIDKTQQIGKTAQRNQSRQAEQFLQLEQLQQAKLLDHDFFARDTVLVAQELLGKLLCRQSPEGLLAGRIVETEAYLGKNDPACHSARSHTKRNHAMFGSAGRHYVYVSYGIHLCYNVTTDREDIPAAVLLRALEPLLGVTGMQARRGEKIPFHKLAAGPGNLCRAMGISMADNDTSALRGTLYFMDDGFQAAEIVTTGRVGISQGQDMLLRFYLAGHPCISRK